MTPALGRKGEFCSIIVTTLPHPVSKAGFSRSLQNRVPNTLECIAEIQEEVGNPAGSDLIRINTFPSICFANFLKPVH